MTSLVSRIELVIVIIERCLCSLPVSRYLTNRLINWNWLVRVDMSTQHRMLLLNLNVILHRIIVGND